MPAINMAGWPFRMAGQRVQPSQTDTATMAIPSTNQMRASTVRLSAPGCHIGRVYERIDQLSAHLCPKPVPVPWSPYLCPEPVEGHRGLDKRPF